MNYLTGIPLTVFACWFWFKVCRWLWLHGRRYNHKLRRVWGNLTTLLRD